MLFLRDKLMPVQEYIQEWVLWAVQANLASLATLSMVLSVGMKWSQLLGCSVSILKYAKISTLLETFYLMVGSYYFLWTKSDWDYTRVYKSFYERSIDKFTKKRGYDLEKEKAL